MSNRRDIDAALRRLVTLPPQYGDDRNAQEWRNDPDNVRAMGLADDPQAVATVLLDSEKRRPTPAQIRDAAGANRYGGSNGKPDACHLCNHTGWRDVRYRHHGSLRAMVCRCDCARGRWLPTYTRTESGAKLDDILDAAELSVKLAGRRDVQAWQIGTGGGIHEWKTDLLWPAELAARERGPRFTAPALREVYELDKGQTLDDWQGTY